jgi:MoaA/NifB/PqqE/SkfB family radical SAM enzyme
MSMPWDHITHLDINGGEPSASPNYKRLLNNLPPNLKSIRINTNASKYIKEIDYLLSKNIQVTITVSLDGTNRIYEYVRWPSKWKTLCKVVNEYKSTAVNINFWTTVNSLNVGDFDNIEDYAKSVGVDHAWAFLSSPAQLNVKYSNCFTIDAKTKIKNKLIADQLAVTVNNQTEIDQFVAHQDSIRNINIKDFL